MVRGIRGAITVDSNTRDAILGATRQLLARILTDNRLNTADIASAIFSLTPDLNAEFPAVAAREIGWTDIPLFCVMEISKPGALEKCIRVLLHVNTELTPSEIRHVYLEKAHALRPDLSVAHIPELDAMARRAIFDIAPYVPGKPIEEVKREFGLTDVIKLASNENPLGPSTLAMQAAAQAIAGLHRYPDGNSFDLKASISRHTGISPESLIVGNGSDEVIKLLAEAFLSPGDEVVVADPTFSEYEFAARLMGAKPVRVPLKDFHHDLPAMARAVTARTKLVFICNPNNPTGTIVNRTELESFLTGLPEGVIVVFDEAYYEYVDDPEYVSGLQLSRYHERCMVLRTFSKVYGLAGLRVGYGIGSSELIALLGRAREPFNVNLVAQMAASAALDDQDHLDRSRQVNREGRALLTQELTTLGHKVCPSQTNFLFVHVGVDSKRLFKALLSLGVIVRTGDIFGHPDFIRVTVGSGEENQRFLSAFKEAVAALSTEEVEK